MFTIGLPVLLWTELGLFYKVLYQTAMDIGSVYGKP